MSTSLPFENSLNLITVCSFCGQPKLDIDVIKVPKLTEFRLQHWPKLFGKMFCERIATIQNPVICRQHFRKTSFTKTLFYLKHNALPKLTEQYYVTMFNNFFHDHCYAQLENPDVISNMREENTEKVTFCLVCGQKVNNTTIINHARGHLSQQALLRVNYLCRNHEAEFVNINVRPFGAHRCLECSNKFSWGLKLQLAAQIRKCYPLYKCKLVEPKQEQEPESIRVCDDAIFEQVAENNNNNDDNAIPVEQEPKVEQIEEPVEPAPPVRKPRKRNHQFEEMLENGEIQSFDEYLQISRPTPCQDLEPEESPDVKKEVDDSYMDVNVKEEINEDPNADFIKQEIDAMNWEDERASGYGYSGYSDEMEYLEDEEDYEESDEEEQESNKKKKKKIDSDEDFMPSDYEDLEDEEELDEHGEPKAKRTRLRITDFQFETIVHKIFNDNQHPSAEILHKLACENCRSFQNVFDAFKKLRNSEKVTCDKDCVCLRIETYLGQDFAKPQGDPNPNNVDISREEIFGRFEHFKIERGQLTRADFILLSEEYQIPPFAVKAWYRKFVYAWREGKEKRERKEQKRQAWMDRNRGIELLNIGTKHVMNRHWNCHRLEAKVVKRLEEEFEKDPHCPAERSNKLCEELNISRNTVISWFIRQRRRRVVPDSIKNTKIERRHTFTTEEKEYLAKKFEQNPRPTRAQCMEMANELKLTLANVITWHMQQRTAERKKLELEALNGLIDNLPEEKENRLMGILNERRKVKFDERLSLAREMEISYQAVTLWFEKRLEELKNQRPRRPRKKRADKLDSDEEEEEEDDYDSEDSSECGDDAQWRAIEELARNATKESDEDELDEEAEDQNDEPQT